MSSSSLTHLGGRQWVVISVSSPMTPFRAGMCPRNWTELSQQQHSTLPQNSLDSWPQARPWNWGMLLWSWVGSQGFRLWKGNLPGVWRDDRDWNAKEMIAGHVMWKRAPGISRVLLPPSILCRWRRCWLWWSNPSLQAVPVSVQVTYLDSWTHMNVTGVALLATNYGTINEWNKILQCTLFI